MLRKLTARHCIFIVLATTIFVLVDYSIFLLNQPLRFHESWSQSEREQITECYNRMCGEQSTFAKELAQEEAAMAVNQWWPKTGSWVERSCRWAYESLGSYSRRVLGQHLMQSTRQMMEDTARTGNVRLTDKNHQSLLHISLLLGAYDFGKALVERGADVNLRSVSSDGMPGDTPLSWAICSMYPGDDDWELLPLSKCREMVDFLLAHGADIKAPGTRDLPVTIQGVMNVSSNDKKRKKEAEEFLIYLLEKGAPQTWKTAGGNEVYLLNFTVGTGKEWRLPYVTRYLLKNGADPDRLPPKLQEKLKTMLLEQDDTLKLESR